MGILRLGLADRGDWQVERATGLEALVFGGFPVRDRFKRPRASGTITT